MTVETTKIFPARSARCESRPILRPLAVAGWPFTTCVCCRRLFRSQFYRLLRLSSLVLAMAVEADVEMVGLRVFAVGRCRPGKGGDVGFCCLGIPTISDSSCYYYPIS